MNKPEEFRQTADEMLGGLVAGQESYQKIIDYQGKRGFAPLELRRMAAFAALFVFMLGIGSVALSKRPQVAKQIETKAAGKEMPQGATMSAWAVPRGSITLSGGGSAPGYLGLWAQGSGANFPLVAVEGRYYRLLTILIGEVDGLRHSIVNVVLERRLHADMPFGGNIVRGHEDLLEILGHIHIVQTAHRRDALHQAF